MGPSPSFDQAKLSLTERAEQKFGCGAGGHDVEAPVAGREDSMRVKASEGRCLLERWDKALAH
jgi:hypothetical protein